MKAFVLWFALGNLLASAQELQFTNIPLSFVSVTNRDADLYKRYQWTNFEVRDGKPVTRVNGVPLEVAVAGLKKAAESGDAVAQMQLGACLYDGKHGLGTNHVEAYKWAVIASANGQPNAKYLVREMELFLAPEEVADGKAAAVSFMSRRDGRKN
jgi:TPR repeat protein